MRPSRAESYKFDSHLLFYHFSSANRIFVYWLKVVVEVVVWILLSHSLLLLFYVLQFIIVCLFWMITFLLTVGKTTSCLCFLILLLVWDLLFSNSLWLFWIKNQQIMVFVYFIYGMAFCRWSFFILSALIEFICYHFMLLFSLSVGEFFRTTLMSYSCWCIFLMLERSVFLYKAFGLWFSVFFKDVLNIFMSPQFITIFIMNDLQFGSLEEFQEEFKDINQEEQISRLHKMLAPHLLRITILNLSNHGVLSNFVNQNMPHDIMCWAYLDH